MVDHGGFGFWWCCGWCELVGDHGGSDGCCGSWMIIIVLWVTGKLNFIGFDILFYCSKYIILLWCLYYFIVLKCKINPLLQYVFVKWVGKINKIIFCGILFLIGCRRWIKVVMGFDGAVGDVNWWVIMVDLMVALGRGWSSLCCGLQGN